MFSLLNFRKKMNSKITSNTALIIIDVQQGFDDPKWGQRNNPNAEGNVSRLISFWRNKKTPHYPYSALLY